jgi:hypothetical protein
MKGAAMPAVDIFAVTLFGFCAIGWVIIAIVIATEGEQN